MPSEPENPSREVSASEEPRYLRRQKPVEIRRRKFGKRTWPFYRRVLVAGAGVIVGGILIYEAASFFLYSPRVALTNLDQIEVTGNRYVTRQSIVERFAKDEGKSVLLVPLDDRRQALENIPWVEHAVVSRILPDRIRVELVERTPVAFLRTGTDLGLIDAHGVLFDRPVEGDFQFPVVSGITESISAAQRELRMGLYTGLLHDLDQVKQGASDHVSEVDLSDATDLRATLAGLSQMGLAGLDDQGPVLVHFGNKDFESKFRILMENFVQWRSSAGRVESVDLRFSKQVVVNPESKTTPVSVHLQAGQSKAR
jgi:cell division protein FtsQ